MNMEHYKKLKKTIVIIYFLMINKRCKDLMKYLRTILMKIVILDILKILSSQKRGGYRGVSIDSFRLPTPSLIFFLTLKGLIF